MQEEIRKEILTREIVKKELKGVYRRNFLVNFILFISILAATVFLAFVEFSDKAPNSTKENLLPHIASVVNIVLVVLVLIGTIVTVFQGYSLYKFFSLLSTVKKEKFEIVIDKLVDSHKVVSSIKMNKVCYEEITYVYKNPTVHLFPKLETELSNKRYLYKLMFEKNKEYFLPTGWLYDWSKLNGMENWRVFRAANIGEEFYVVVANNKPLYVYNTKHFELKE